jgi:hypothetical protein
MVEYSGMRICFQIDELELFNECYPCARRIYTFFKDNNSRGVVEGFSTREIMALTGQCMANVKKGVWDLERLGLVVRPPRPANNVKATYVLPFVVRFFDEVDFVGSKIVS